MIVRVFLTFPLFRPPHRGSTRGIVRAGQRLALAALTAAFSLSACSSGSREVRTVASLPAVVVPPPAAPVPQTPSPVAPASIPREEHLGTEPIDRIVVYKERRTLLLYRGDRPVKSYRVALGFNPVGHKQRQGDGRTPEGLYFISAKNPRSAFYRSLRIDYPSPADVERARSLGIDPGGDIVIHGLPNTASPIERLEHPAKDWTNGCIALDDREMDEIWTVVQENTPIYIYP